MKTAAMSIQFEYLGLSAVRMQQANVYLAQSSLFLFTIKGEQFFTPLVHRLPLDLTIKKLFLTIKKLFEPISGEQNIHQPIELRVMLPVLCKKIYKGLTSTPKVISQHGST